MNTFLIHAQIVPPGHAVALAVLDGIESDEFVVMYTPDPAKADYSPFMVNGAELKLSIANSPLVLTLPGRYTLQQDGEISDNVNVEASPNPFPITLVKAIP